MLSGSWVEGLEGIWVARGPLNRIASEAPANCSMKRTKCDGGTILEPLAGETGAYEVG